MTFAGNTPQGEMAMVQSFSDRLREIYVRRIIRTPESLLWALNTWEASGDGSARLLQLLTQEMTPEWWMRQRSAVKKQILGKLMQIDGERGIIGNWLALIVRLENDVSVLELAAGWESWKHCLGSRWLDVWHEKGFNSPSGTHAIQKTVLKVIASTTLSSNTSLDAADGRIWSEEQRMEIILQYLSQQHPSLDLKEVVDKLEIMAHCELSPQLHGKKVLHEIFHEWERHMQNIANIITESSKEWKTYYKIWGICNPRSSERTSDRRFIQQRYLRATWEGLIRLSPYCPDISNRLLPWMEYWLQRGNMVAFEVEREMSRWNPPDECLQEQVSVLWSRYLLSYTGDNYGYNSSHVWMAAGRYFTECREPGPGMKEICHNYLKALGSAATLSDAFSSGASRDTRMYHEGLKAMVMKAIVCPPWLTKEQQTKWKKVWSPLMQSASVGELVRAAARHLLGLVTNGFADENSVKKDILKRLEDLKTGTCVEIIHGLLDEIRKWEKGGNSSGEMFYDVWGQVRQCRWWDTPEVREVAIKTLALYLKEKGDASPRLVSLWLETLGGERNSEIWCSLQAGQREIMNIHPGFCPASVEMWKQLVWDRNPKIRRLAWEFFLSLGDRMGNETGLLLTGRLPKEKSWNVLRIMAQWRPPAGEPLPAGFGKAWANCLQGLARHAVQSFVSKQIWQFEMEKRLGNIISIAGSVVKSCAIAWLEEGPGFDRQSAKLSVLRMFWETMAETMREFSGEFSGGEVVREIKRVQNNVDALFRLDESPGKFLDIFTVVTADDKDKAADENFWEGLVKNLKGRDMEMLPVNVRHNLGMVAVFLLGQKKRIDEELQQIFVELCGDGTWTPGRVPAGWEEFCREFYRTCKEVTCGKLTRAVGSVLKKICVMSRIGHAGRDERGHQLFRQTLCQVMGTTNPELAAVIESALWHEVVMDCEVAERLVPDGKGLDEAGRRRWLRGLLRSCEEKTAGACEVGEGSREFVNALWVELGTVLFSREAGGDRGQGWGDVSTLDRQEIVFVHPHRDRNVLSEAVGRWTEGKHLPQIGQSLSLTD